MIRLFVAVAIPTEIGEGLERRRQGIPGARWHAAETLHLTLRFAGEISEALADDFDAALLGVTADAFDLVLSGVGAFGDGRDIHTVWAGIEDNPAASRLAARCESAARRAGLKPDTRIWRPHVTLAYLNRPDPARVAAWIQGNNLLRSPPFRVSGFGLYSSRRSERGSVYTLERRYRLTR